MTTRLDVEADLEGDISLEMTLEGDHCEVVGAAAIDTAEEVAERVQETDGRVRFSEVYQ